MASGDRSSQLFRSACPTLRDAMMVGDWGHEAPIQFNGTLRNKHHDPRVPADCDTGDDGAVDEGECSFLPLDKVYAGHGGSFHVPFKAGYPGRKEDFETNLGHGARVDEEAQQQGCGQRLGWSVPQLLCEQRARIVISYIAVPKNRPFG